MSEHPVRPCAHCGKYDDHPRVVFWDDEGDKSSRHHDCLDADQRAGLMKHPIAAKVIEAAEGGVHGDELRAHIERLHKKGGK